MKIHTPVEACPSFAIRRNPAARARFNLRHAFSLIEVLVVVSLLSLIVLVLMTVFNSTQSAFRAAVTQTDILEGGRAAMDLLVSDLKSMTPSGSYSNSAVVVTPVNFYASANFNNYQPLVQDLPGSTEQRTNVLENIFFVSRQNLNGHDSWVGTGYTVNATNIFPLYPLYRFTTNCPASSGPSNLFSAFIAAIRLNAFTNTGWSHLIDGVVDLRVHAFDPNGYQMTNTFQYNNNANQYTTYTNALFLAPQWGEIGFYFFSNTIPASVDVQMGTIEDRVLQRAESMGPQSPAQDNFLAQQAGRVHVFRQRVLLPNVDPSAYP